MTGRARAVVLVVLFLLTLPAPARARGPYALLQAGGQCTAGGTSDTARAAARSHQIKLMPAGQVASAQARVRAGRALTRARVLYTRANFAGCVALLSITEQELGLHLSDHRSTSQQEAHRLLARVNLWLGICQWAAGDPQTAAIAFVRSSQLPGSPVPNPRLLPPAVVRAYRNAVVAPRQQVGCEVLSPLTPDMVQVNGRGPVVQGRNVLVPTGTHYLVLALPGHPPGKQSLRLQASSLRCKVQVPSTRPTRARSCVSLKEASDPTFIASITRETGATGSLVVSLDGNHLALRLHQKGKAVFERQLMVQVDANKGPAEVVVARSMRLLLHGGTGPTAPPPRSDDGWYTKWWVWALVGTAVAVTATTAIVASQNDRVKLVFGP